MKLFEAQEMMEAFRKGEERGFSHFYRWLYPNLLYYSFKITKDKVEAEDVVEESFIKIWERKENFFEAGKVKSWMYATVRNACFDQLRCNQKDKKGVDDLSILLEGNVHKGQDDLMIEAEVVSRIYHHLNCLPPRCKTTLQLLFIEGKTLGEAAEAMKVSINTIKNQRGRGLALIKKHFP